MRLPRLAVIIDKILLHISYPLYLILPAGLIIICIGIALLIDTRLALGLFAGIVLAAQLLIFRRIFHEARDHYRQIEALFSVQAVLPLRTPLPSMREWAISPDLASLIISLIHEYQPKTIVEASSGVSTLISGYCLQNSTGKVISLESNEAFATVTARNVKRHGLSDTAQVIYSPLVPYTINGEKWLWYDMKALNSIPPIDMLIVDGPIDRTQKLARYPALPLLFKHLSNRALIVLDDGIRREEQEIIRRWLQEYSGFEVERIPTVKVTFVLHRKP